MTKEAYLNLMDVSKMCGNCKHWIAHYIKLGDGEYMQLGTGHCIESKVKDREARSICINWEREKNKE